MPSIDILCIAGPNAEDYAAYLLRNAQSLASGLHDLHWKTVVSKSEKTLPGFEKIGFVPGVGQGSATHAACLDVGIPLLTSEYCFLLDLDVLFALRGWDDIAVQMLRKADCFGAAYPVNYRNYRKFPTVIFFATKTKVLQELKVSMMPVISGRNTIESYAFKSDAEASLFGYKRAKEQIYADTGWLLPKAFNMAGKTGAAMQAVTGTLRQRRLKYPPSMSSFFEDYPNAMAEFIWKDSVYASHLTNSRKFKFNNPEVVAWRMAIESYIRGNGK